MTGQGIQTSVFGGGGGDLGTIKCRWSPFSWWVSGLQSQLRTPLYFLCCTYLPRSSHICGLKQLWLSQSLWLVYIPQNLKRLQPHWFDLTLYASIKQLGSWSGGNSMLWRNVIVFPPPHPPPSPPPPPRTKNTVKTSTNGIEFWDCVEGFVKLLCVAHDSFLCFQLFCIEQ